MFEKRLTELKEDYERLKDEHESDTVKAKEIREQIREADNYAIGLREEFSKLPRTGRQPSNKYDKKRNSGDKKQQHIRRKSFEELDF